MAFPRSIYETTGSHDERAQLQRRTVLAIKDAWYTLLLTHPELQADASAHVALPHLEVEVPGKDALFSLDFSLNKYNPQGNLTTELASLSVRVRYTDDQGRLQFRTISSLNLTGGPDDEGRVALTVSETRTEPGYEGRGFGRGLTNLLQEALPVLLRVHENEWAGKTVYVIRTDRARPAQPDQAKRLGIRREGWTTGQALEQGFTDDPDYVRDHLGDGFLPLPERTFVRVYQDAEPEDMDIPEQNPE